MERPIYGLHMTSGTYVCHPFSPGEMVYRIRNLLKNMFLQKTSPCKPLRWGRARVGMKSLAAYRMCLPPHPHLPPRRGKEYNPSHQSGVLMLCGLI